MSFIMMGAPWRLLAAACLWHHIEGQDYQVTDRRVEYEGAPVNPGTFDNVTAKQCEAFCNGNSTCNSFSYCGSSCYLKQACIVDGEALVNASLWTDGCVTYYKSCSALAPYTAMPRLLLEQGAEIDNVMTDNLGTCAEACNSNPQCKSFTFFAPSRGCHLKDKCVESGDALVAEDSPAAVYRSFYRCCTCTTTTTTTTESPWQVLPRALEFEGIPVIPGTYEGAHTVQQCQAFCDSNSSCRSVTFCDAGCYLKQRCASLDQPLVPVEGWNGCVTYYKPCGGPAPESSDSSESTENGTSNISNASDVANNTGPNSSELSSTTTSSANPSDATPNLVEFALSVSAAETWRRSGQVLWLPAALLATIR